MDTNDVALSLLSGGLGSFAVLFAESVRQSYAQQKEDLIGTITLLNKLQGNVTSLNVLADTILVTYQLSQEFTQQPVAEEMEISFEMRMGDLLLETIEADRNITLKYSSLGCFYVLEQLKKNQLILGAMIEQFSKGFERYKNSEDISLEYNISFLEHIADGFKILSNMLCKFTSKYTDLLEQSTISLQRYTLLNYRQRKDVKRVREIIVLTKAQIVQLNNKLAVIVAREEHAL